MALNKRLSLRLPLVSQPDPLKWERNLFITYLDETTLVVRDETGSPDIFARKSAAPVDAVFEEDLSSETLLPEVPQESMDDFIDVPSDIKTTDYEM